MGDRLRGLKIAPFRHYPDVRVADVTFQRSIVGKMTAVLGYHPSSRCRRVMRYTGEYLQEHVEIEMYNAAGLVKTARQAKKEVKLWFFEKLSPNEENL